MNIKTLFEKDWDAYSDNSWTRAGHKSMYWLATGYDKHFVWYVGQTEHRFAIVMRKATPTMPAKTIAQSHMESMLEGYSGRPLSLDCFVPTAICFIEHIKIAQIRHCLDKLLCGIIWRENH